MQKIYASLALTSVLFAACNGMKEQKALTTDQIHKIEDGIPKIIPSVTLINTRQGEDHTKVTIILGDPTFYAATDADKQRKAIEIGKLVLETAGVENNLHDGNMIITKNIQNQSESPADGIILNMKLDSLNNELYKK